MRKYPEKYLEILKNETIEIENNGVKIIVKPSPGEEREGYLDPCEKAIMEGHWASKTADNNQQQKEEAKQPVINANKEDENEDSKTSTISTSSVESWLKEMEINS